MNGFITESDFVSLFDVFFAGWQDTNDRARSMAEMSAENRGMGGSVLKTNVSKKLQTTKKPVIISLDESYRSALCLIFRFLFGSLP